MNLSVPSSIPSPPNKVTTNFTPAFFPSTASPPFLFPALSIGPSQALLSNIPSLSINFSPASTNPETNSLSFALLIGFVPLNPSSPLLIFPLTFITVRLWDAATGAALQTLEGHSNYVTTVAFSPDGKSIASGPHDSTVRLWDAATGAALQTLEGHSNYVSTVAFSPDGKSIASGPHDSTVRLWDAATGAALQMLEDHSNYVRTVASISVVQDEWILKKGKMLLWLPPEYRSTEVSIHNSLVCLGLGPGRVIIIGFEYDLV